jgi:hypothetical protein
VELFIDKKPSNQYAAGAADVMSALMAASEDLRQQGRVILSVRMDGVALSPDTMLETLKDKPTAEAGVVDIVSDDITHVVCETLDELEAVLPDLPEACHSLAEVFQGQDPAAGYEPFDRLATIWKTVKEREMQVVNALNIDTSAFLVSGAPLVRMHGELNTFLAEAAEALKNEDCILLGDLLEYELAPKAEAELEIVRALRKAAGV